MHKKKEGREFIPGKEIAKRRSSISFSPAMLQFRLKRESMQLPWARNGLLFGHLRGSMSKFSWSCENYTSSGHFKKILW
jgi:hypothetical protein